MQELEPTWERVVSVWWLLAWRGLLGAILLGAAVGFAISVAGTLVGFTGAQIRPFASLPGAIVGLGWALVAVRMALLKRYKEFRIALVPVAAP